MWKRFILAWGSLFSNFGQFDLQSTSSAEGFFVDFNGDPELSVSNPAQIYSITADSISYAAVPEPASVALLLLGGVMCRGIKRFRKS